MAEAVGEGVELAVGAGLRFECPPDHSHSDHCYRIHKCRCDVCRGRANAEARERRAQQLVAIKDSPAWEKLDDATRFMQAFRSRKPKRVEQVWSEIDRDAVAVMLALIVETYGDFNQVADLVRGTEGIKPAGMGLSDVWKIALASAEKETA